MAGTSVCTTSVERSGSIPAASQSFTISSVSRRMSAGQLRARRERVHVREQEEAVVLVLQLDARDRAPDTRNNIRTGQGHYYQFQ